MTLSARTRLGPYEISSPLGAGGMGEVYKATDTRLDRTVAIKVLPEHVAADPDLKPRFEREAKTLASLSHPHICPVFDVGSQDGIDFLVMEYLEGETLEQRLKKGALPFDEALQLGIQIADALSAAHRAGIVHRDLKPGNIMLTKSGAKLLDFGLAKTAAHAVAGSLSMLPTTPPGLTAQGTILGTFQYMAPEQLEGQEADARTDIFAFGAVVYEMVTAKKAFEGKSQASLIAAILDRDPPKMSSLQPLTPPALDHIVSRCLAKEPDDRWQAASDVMREVKWIAEAPRADMAMPASVRHGSRERMAWALLGVAVLGLMALAVPTTLYVRGAVAEPAITRLDVVTPPTTDAFSFALSPDGRQLVFNSNGEKGPQLWLRPLDQTTAQPLAGTEGASFPFWAPDGSAVGFFADGKLKRMNLTGGAVQVLADAPAPRGGTWNRDGVIVFAPSTYSALLRVAASGGAVAPVTRLASGQVSHRWPQFLPDGRRFLFSMPIGLPQTNGAYIGSLDGGEPTRVMSAERAAVYAAPGYLLVVSQGVLAAYRFDAVRGTVAGEPIPVAQGVGIDDGAFHSAFSASESEQGVLAHRAGGGFIRQLVWVDRTGKMLGVFGSPDLNTLTDPELTSNGQRLAVHRSVQGNVDVWLFDVSRGVPNRFTFDAGIDASPIWSPDGNQLVFRSTRQGGFDLFQKSASGSVDEQPLLTTPENESPLDWSQDGRFLLYGRQNPQSASDIWALPMMGERKPFVVLHSAFDEIQGQFSPDGRWLAYASNESGRYEIYVQTFPKMTGKWQVSAAGGMQPRWRRDGRELFYVAPDTRLMAVTLHPAPDRDLLQADTPVALFPTRLVSGGNVPTAGFQADAQYAVTPDGRFLLNVAPDDAATSPITIVQNWQSALGAREGR